MLLSPHRWPKRNLVLGFSFNAIIFTWRQVWFYWSSTNYTLCFGIWTRSHVTCSQDFSPQDTYRIFFADTQSFLGVMEWLAKKTNIHPSTDYISKQISKHLKNYETNSTPRWIMIWTKRGFLDFVLGITCLIADSVPQIWSRIILISLSVAVPVNVRCENCCWNLHTTPRKLLWVQRF